MATWVQRTLVEGPRNGTTSHTFAFPTPAAGALLLAVGAGGVTFSTPAGWTLEQSAINWTGHYLWSRIADGTETEFTTTHNGADYPAVLVVYEFAPGSTFVGAVAQAGLGDNDPNPTLSGLTGTNLLMASADGPAGNGMPSANTSTWTGATQDLEYWTGPNGTDGIGLATAYVEDSAATSFAPTQHWYQSTTYREAITWAVKPASGTTPIPGQGTATGAWAYGSAGSGEMLPKGSGLAAWALDSAGTGKELPVASGAGSLSWDSAGSGAAPVVAPHAGSGSGALAWSASSAGRRAPRGAGSGTLSWGAAGSGSAPLVAPHSGEGTSGYSWAATAAGTRPSVAFKAGHGGGYWGFNSWGEGERPSHGSGSGSFAWSGTAVAAPPKFGAGSGELAWSSSAAGFAGVTLPADITVSAGVPYVLWAAGAPTVNAYKAQILTRWEAKVGSNNRA